MPAWAGLSVNAAMAPLRPGQCVLYTNHGLFYSWRPPASPPALWIDNLYIRTTAGYEVVVQDDVREARGVVWLSRLTMQDDASNLNNGTDVDGPERGFLTMYGDADVLVEGVGGYRPGLLVCLLPDPPGGPSL